MYAQNPKIWNPNNSKALEAVKPKEIKGKLIQAVKPKEIKCKLI